MTSLVVVQWSQAGSNGPASAAPPWPPVPATPLRDERGGGDDFDALVGEHPGDPGGHVGLFAGRRAVERFDDDDLGAESEKNWPSSKPT